MARCFPVGIMGGEVFTSIALEVEPALRSVVTRCGSTAPAEQLMGMTKMIQCRQLATYSSPHRGVYLWVATLIMFGCGSDLPPRRVGLANPVSIATLQENQAYPLSWITSASFSPNGKLLLIVQRHSYIAHLYEARTGRLIRTLRFPTELCDTIVAHNPRHGIFHRYLQFERIPTRYRRRIAHQVHNGFFTSDSTVLLTGYIDAIGEDDSNHHVVEYAAQLTSFVYMDTSGQVTRVSPTQYPSMKEFQNSDAVAYSRKQHRWYLNHEYWDAYERGHYDSMMMVASFNDTGADKRTSFPLPKELWDLSVDYGPATPHFAIDSNNNFYAVLACLPYVYDETGSIRFTLDLPVSNTAFLRESRVAFVNHEPLSAEHVWDRDSFVVVDVSVDNDRLIVVTAVNQASPQSSRYYFLVQEYSINGELLSQTTIGDKGPLGKPKFFGINSATRKPYLIAQKDDVFKLYQLSWK